MRFLVPSLLLACTMQTALAAPAGQGFAQSRPTRSPYSLTSFSDDPPEAPLPAAIAQGSETWRLKSGKDGKFIWTDTWLKRNGSWQIIARHTAGLPGDAPPAAEAGA